MTIREYADSDERGWVRCRLLSFLDSSYYDDVRREKEQYENPSICLVAEEGDQIVGILDVEYEQNGGEACYLGGGRGAVIWHLGVLPECRGKGVAAALWNTAKGMLREKGVVRCEAWTQDDTDSNRWYTRQGFQCRESYLNAYIKGNPHDKAIKKLLHAGRLGRVYGIRCFNFEVPLERKAEMEKICYRLHEVKLYELRSL